MNLEPAPRLPKWIFLAIDAGLLAVAFLIVSFAPNPYAPLPFVSAVVCVALAAIIGLVPFLADYAADTAEAVERERERINEHAVKLHATIENLARTAAHIKSVEEAVHKSAREAETLPYRMQEKLAEFNETLAAREESDREALETELEELRAAQNGQLKAVAEKVAKAAAELTAAEAAARAQVAALNSGAGDAAKAADAALARLQAGARDAAAKLEAAAATAAATFEARLAAALREVDVHFAAARSAAAAPAPVPAEPAAVPTPPAPVVPPVAAAAPATDAPTEAAPATEGPADLSAMIAEVPKPRKPRPPRKPKADEAPAAAPETAASESAPAAEAAPVSAPAPEPTAESSASGDEAPAAGPVESSTSSDGATRLLATAYIGIGNKLFIRGDGPGLSWDQGVPMQFVSIGKWGWSTHDAAGPIRCKLYKNDESAALTGEIVLEAGRHTEVTALF
jgi:chemotaxis protein histidine kinase CheA